MMKTTTDNEHNDPFIEPFAQGMKGKTVCVFSYSIEKYDFI